MWWVYLLVFFGGSIFGAMLMALMVAAKNSGREEGDDGHRME